jgi:hypothetical protein
MEQIKNSVKLAHLRAMNVPTPQHVCHAYLATFILTTHAQQAVQADTTVVITSAKVALVLVIPVQTRQPAFLATKAIGMELIAPTSAIVALMVIMSPILVIRAILIA